MPSRTALMTALARAKHQSDDPVVFRDPFAVPMLGSLMDEPTEGGEAATRHMVSGAGRGAIVARSAVAEAEMALAFDAGVRQFVVLGAGLDTTALRHPDRAVYEVDHPSTQPWKFRSLQALGRGMPGNAVYVAGDLEHQALVPLLCDHGFDASRPAFFTALGLSMYMAPARTERLLEAISALPRGSGIVLDYLYQPRPWAIGHRLVLALLKRRFARLGEPWIGFHDPGRLETHARALGFHAIRNHSRRELNHSLFESRGSALSIKGERLGGVLVARLA